MLTSAFLVLREYQRYIEAVWNKKKPLIDKLNVLAYGAGASALVMSLAMNNELANRINKIAFVECRESVAKALALTKNRGNSSKSDVFAVSPVVRALENKAIMFELSTSPTGSMISDAKDSGCACPVISVRES